MSTTEEVERGAAWLDAVRPGWELDLDLSDLELSCPENCVLGQLFGMAAYESATFLESTYNVANGYGYVEWMLGVADHPDLWMEEHGFADLQHRYDVLQDEWLECVKARFDAGLVIP